MSTGAAVVGVRLLINTRTTAAVARTAVAISYAGAVAHDVAGSASANTLLATRAVLAYIATGAAVVGIGVQIDAGAIAQHLTGLAPCTDSTHTYLARQAGMAAGTAVLGVGLQVYAGATTLGQSALANAGAIATGRVVAAVRCGCSTGLAR